ncbi:hypothetical protein IH601_01775, partial [Candidatus Bipolaricaulota bacterium]|nr:hypothetical protein [Candidatus Bipolaricaulota bacterium]
MQSTRQYEKAMTTLVFMKKRLRLALNYARSTPMSQDESLLARADRNTRHRLMFIQKFPMRILMLVAVGTFFFFFVSENKVGLMVMMFI